MTIADVPARLAAAADASLRWHPGGPFDLQQTLGTLLRGPGDPSFPPPPDGLWTGVHDAGTVRPRCASPLRAERAEPGAVDAQAWGPGSAAGPAGSCRGMLGGGDDWTAFDEPAFHATLPRMVREARRRNLAVRLPATGRVVDCARAHHPGAEGHRDRGPARLPLPDVPLRDPGAGGRTVRTRQRLCVQPTPEQWLRIPSWEWHQAGVGPQRSATVMRALRSAVALERLAVLPAPEAAAKLQAIPGIGIWTAAEVVQRTHGCPDSIAVGDYHLAAYVGAALTGRRTMTPACWRCWSRGRVTGSAWCG